MPSPYLTPQQEATAKDAGIDYDPKMDQAAAQEFTRYLALITAAEAAIIAKKPTKPFMIKTTRKAPYMMEISYTEPKEKPGETWTGTYQPKTSLEEIKKQAVRIADVLIYGVN